MGASPIFLVNDPSKPPARKAAGQIPKKHPSGIMPESIRVQPECIVGFTARGWGFDPLQKVDRIPRPGMRRSIGNEGTVGKRWNAGVLSGVRAAAMLSDAGRFVRDGRSVVGTPPYLLSL